MKLRERLDTVDLPYWIARAVEGHGQWTSTFAPYERHPSLEISDDRFATVFENYEKLLHGNYPFFHPRYIGQMLKPPHEAAVVAYLSAMLINPNNHSSDGGPVTDRMEREVIDQLAAMFGFGSHLGHLTSSGTMANLEALYVARCLHPGRGVAYSSASHYTHERMTRLLGMDSRAVPADRYGRMDLDALEDVLRTGKVGTVVFTLGTTGVGALDPLAEAMALRERYDVRFHVDAAYGGFYSVLSRHARAGPRAVAGGPRLRFGGGRPAQAGPAALRLRFGALRRSVGGEVLRARFALHLLHPGGPAPRRDQPGVLAGRGHRRRAVVHLPAAGPDRRRARRGARGQPAGRAAPRRADGGLGPASAAPGTRPGHRDLLPAPRGDSLSGIGRACAAMLEEGMHDGADPVFLSLMRIERDAFAQLHPDVRTDADSTRILRSVLMKPESETYVDELHQRLERLSASQGKEG